MTEQSINLERMEEAASLFGPFDENIRIIERELHVQIVVRDDELKISGDGEQVMYAEKAVRGLLSLCARGNRSTSRIFAMCSSWCFGARRARSVSWPGM